MLTRGGAVAQLVKRWVWHTAVVGSIPQHDKGRFSQSSAFSADSLTVFVQPLVCSHMHQHTIPYNFIAKCQYSCTSNVL